MRPIDADALIKKIFPYDVVDKKCYTINAKMIHEAIKEAPTVDIKTEVAREILGYVEKHLRIKRKQIDIPFTSRDMRNYQCGAIDIIEYFEELVAELKNKYTKEGGEG